MTEDEREDLIYRLLEDFQQSIVKPLSDEQKFSFIAGARAAIHAVSQLR